MMLNASSSFGRLDRTLNGVHLGRIAGMPEPDDFRRLDRSELLVDGACTGKERQQARRTLNVPFLPDRLDAELAGELVLGRRLRLLVAGLRLGHQGQRHSRNLVELLGELLVHLIGGLVSGPVSEKYILALVLADEHGILESPRVSDIGIDDIVRDVIVENDVIADDQVGFRRRAHALHASQALLGSFGEFPFGISFEGAEMPAKDRRAFLKGHRWSNASRAAAIMEDMAAAGDAFDFADEDELKSEIDKRLSTVGHMEESQQTVEKVPGDKRAAF